jgi:hypothetical protein
MDNIVRAIKIAALDAIESQKPVDVMFGMVVSDFPLVINIEQRLQLTEEYLVLMRGVEVDLGDRVVLLREQGGQEFVVLGVMEERGAVEE